MHFAPTLFALASSDALGKQIATPRRPTSPGRRSGPQGVDIAVLEISGPLAKSSSPLTDAIDTTLLTNQIKELASDDSIGGVLLSIDSPGGAAAGIHGLSEAVKELASKKPVFVHTDGIMASAAYFAAAHATEITATEDSLTGSIGTLAIISDFSEAAKNAGVQVHVVSTGFAKGMGAVGSEISKEQLASLRELVNDTNKLFLDAVRTGRGMSNAFLNHVSDGRVFIGSKAKGFGLIDDIETFDSALARLTARARASSGSSATAARFSRGSTSQASQPGSSRQAWRALVNKHMARGMSRSKAAQLANRENEGLRLAMIEEARAT